MSREWLLLSLYCRITGPGPPCDKLMKTETFYGLGNTSHIQGMCFFMCLSRHWGSLEVSVCWALGADLWPEFSAEHLGIHPWALRRQQATWEWVPISFFGCCFCFILAVAACALGLLLVICSGITPGGAQGTIFSAMINLVNPVQAMWLKFYYCHCGLKFRFSSFMFFFKDKRNSLCQTHFGAQGFWLCTKITSKLWGP